MRIRWVLVWLCRVLLVPGYVVLALWLAACPLMWILRDGLGPNSRETTGWAALVKFSPMLFLGLAVAAWLVLLHLGDWWLRRGDSELGGE